MDVDHYIFKRLYWNGTETNQVKKPRNNTKMNQTRLKPITTYMRNNHLQYYKLDSTKKTFFPVIDVLNPFIGCQQKQKYNVYHVNNLKSTVHFTFK